MYCIYIACSSYIEEGGDRMSTKMKAMTAIKSLIFSYAFTGVALAILAFAVYKLQLTESIVNIFIIAIYIVASFIGAFLTGKKVKEKKFIWGLLLGGMLS